MNEQQPITSKPIDLGLNPRDPWGVMPPEIRVGLAKDLKIIADNRRRVEVSSRELPMP